MNNLTFEAIKPPMEADTDNVIRVGGTRVTLDAIVELFASGATAEEIVIQFPTLNLRDVYSTISFFLNHQSEVDEYLKERREQSQNIKASNEANFPPTRIRQRLLARQSKA